MIKPLYVGIVIAILIAVGGGAFVLSNRNNPEVSKTAEIETNPQTNSSTEAPRSIKDLLSYKGTQQCSFSSEGNTGLIYMSGGKMRADFTVTLTPGNTNSHMIVDGQSVYIWTENQTTGVKITTDAIEEFDTPNQAATIDPNQDMDFNCSSWTANQSVFTPPTNVSFAEIDSSLKVDGNAPPAISCSTCDTMPESARADCRAALCN